jgi:hypothetical protein
MPARSGELQLLRLTEILADDATDGDYGTPEVRGILPHSRAVFVSDFLGDITAAEGAIAKATDRGVSGAILQILDPQEEAFPFDGRTIFESMGRSVTHETLKAGDLRGRYLERLAERKDRLAGLARATGWQYDCHHTDRPASGALLWLYRSLEGCSTDVDAWPHRLHRPLAPSGARRAADPVDPVACGPARRRCGALSGGGAASGAEGRRERDRQDAVVASPAARLGHRGGDHRLRRPGPEPQARAGGKRAASGALGRDMGRCARLGRADLARRGDPRRGVARGADGGGRDC